MKPFLRHLDFLDFADAIVHRLAVHFHDGRPFLFIGLFNSFFQIFHRIVDGNDAGQLEKGCLHDHVDAAAKADLFCNVPGVDDIELCVFFCQSTLYGCRQVVSDGGFVAKRVQQKCSAVGQVFQHVILPQVGLIVACHEVGPVDQIGGLNRRFAEPEMGHGQAAGFLGVIAEIALCIQVGFSPMILMAVLLAPTVPSEPRPQNLHLMVPSGSRAIPTV